MITTSKQKAWSKAIAEPASEFDLTPLEIIEGGDSCRFAWLTLP